MKQSGWCSVELRALLLCVLVSALALAVLAFERWWLRRSVRRLVARLQRDREVGVRDTPRLLPESLYVVRLSDAGVTCNHPDGDAESVEWDDLQRVEIVTTDRGPRLPDVFWVLHGSEAGCVVPQGATGKDELLGRLQRLPGFRNEAVIEAGPSAGNRRFLCWERAAVAESG